MGAVAIQVDRMTAPATFKQESRAMTSLFVNLTLPKIDSFAPFLREFAENTATGSADLALSGKTAILLLIANEVRGLLVVAGVLGWVS